MSIVYRCPVCDGLIYPCNVHGDIYEGGCQECPNKTICDATGKELKYNLLAYNNACHCTHKDLIAYVAKIHEDYKRLEFNYISMHQALKSEIEINTRLKGDLNQALYELAKRGG